MEKNSKIFITGHNGMVGSAMLRLLKRKGYKNFILKDKEELDLRNQSGVDAFMRKEKPDYVFFFAARVGGIKSNMEHPAEYLYDNLTIETNVVHFSYKNHVKKLLFLGSSCIYPRICRQPMKEEYLLTGKLEPTNEGYAVAKIAGLKLCEFFNKQFNCNFLSLVPSNVYGPGDNFDLVSSHVVAALIRKFIEAKRNNLKSVTIWGTGKARREFLYVDDLADACLFFMNRYHAKSIPSFINIGYGEDVSIKNLVKIINRQIGYEGKIIWDTSMPDGMPRKLLDSTVARKLGWHAKTSLEEGIKKTILWYKNHSF